MESLVEESKKLPDVKVERITEEKHRQRNRVAVYDALDDKVLYWDPMTARENLARSLQDQAAGRGRRYWPAKNETKPDVDADEVEKARAAHKDEIAVKAKAEAAKGDAEAMEAKILALQHDLAKATAKITELVATKEAPHGLQPTPQAEAQAQAPLDELSDDALRALIAEAPGPNPKGLHMMGRAKLLDAARAL